MPNCTICLEKIKLYHKKNTLDCGHVFHKNCIDTWLRNTNSCPNCRKVQVVDFTPKINNFVVVHIPSEDVVVRNSSNIIARCFYKCRSNTQEETEENSEFNDFHCGHLYHIFAILLSLLGTFVLSFLLLLLICVKGNDYCPICIIASSLFGIGITILTIIAISDWKPSDKFKSFLALLLSISFTLALANNEYEYKCMFNSYIFLALVILLPVCCGCIHNIKKN